MKHVLFVLGIVVLALLPLSVRAGVCPVLVPECYPMDLEAELETAHLLDASIRPIRTWELDAIRVIRSGHVHTRTLVDVFDHGVYGFAHFDSPRDICASLPVCEDLDNASCPLFVEDPTWLEPAQAILYSPYSAGKQLQAWRRIIGPGISAARRNGLDSAEGLILAACISNSVGGRGFSDIGRIANWEAKAILKEYFLRSPTHHRSRRVQLLERIIF